jgi:vacuolar-type H+-ATPase subunit I/STV1
MTTQTRFLSRLLGLFCLIAGLTMLLQRQSTVQTVTALLADRPLTYVLGVIVLFAGLAIVLVHNRWSGGAVAVIVTLIGWLTLLKGILLFTASAMDSAEFYLVQLRYAQLYFLYTAITLLLGACLTWAGFSRAGGRAPAGSAR